MRDLLLVHVEEALLLDAVAAAGAVLAPVDVAVLADALETRRGGDSRYVVTLGHGLGSLRLPKRRSLEDLGRDLLAPAAGNVDAAHALDARRLLRDLGAERDAVVRLVQPGDERVGDGDAALPRLHLLGLLGALQRLDADDDGTALGDPRAAQRLHPLAEAGEIEHGVGEQELRAGLGLLSQVNETERKRPEPGMGQGAQEGRRLGPPASLSMSSSCTGSTSKTPAASGHSPRAWCSPERQRMFAIPSADAPSTSEWRAMRLRSRVARREDRLAALLRQERSRGERAGAQLGAAVGHHHRVQKLRQGSGRLPQRVGVGAAGRKAFGEQGRALGPQGRGQLGSRLHGRAHSVSIFGAWAGAGDWAPALRAWP